MKINKPIINLYYLNKENKKKGSSMVAVDFTLVCLAAFLLVIVIYLKHAK